ncbi:unnamed protein product [Caenorhabditis auriculariae]|uniref:Apple domain-containing protein n=1 Tax=Caenorhabditis auriculariae TaxID=2777116 RepID=A0A8S1HJU1_9PELO|nr:unnamed protein product [Caenorhabditis auriculariae]
MGFTVDFRLHTTSVTLKAWAALTVHPPDTPRLFCHKRRLDDSWLHSYTSPKGSDSASVPLMSSASFVALVLSVLVFVSSAMPLDSVWVDGEGNAAAFFDGRYFMRPYFSNNFQMANPMPKRSPFSKRRGRELFGKRSAPMQFGEESFWQSAERNRRRANELFGRKSRKSCEAQKVDWFFVPTTSQTPWHNGQLFSTPQSFCAWLPKTANGKANGRFVVPRKLPRNLLRRRGYVSPAVSTMRGRIFLFPLLLALRTAGLPRPKDVFSCFALHTNTFLEKSGNVLIEDVHDVYGCLRRCFQAAKDYGFRCKSAMYNVNAGSCILSKFDRGERKVKTAKHLQIDMYENNCLNESGTAGLSEFVHQTRTTASPLTGNQVRRAKYRNLFVHAVKQYAIDSKPPPLKRIVENNAFARPSSTTSNSANSKAKRISNKNLMSSTAISNETWKTNENCFKRTPSRVLTRFEEQTLQETSLSECMLACVVSSRFYCASFNFSPTQKVCVLNGGNLHLNGATFNQSRSFDYYENTCRPRVGGSSAAKTAEHSKLDPKCFRIHKNSLLNSFDAVIVPDAAQLDGCMKACNSGESKCVALNWVETPGGCMIFYRSYDASLIVASNKGSFVVNNCPSSPNERRKTTSGSSNDYYDQIS